MNSLVPSQGIFSEQTVDIIWPPMIALYPLTENQVFPRYPDEVNQRLFCYLSNFRCQTFSYFLIRIKKQNPFILGFADGKTTDWLNNSYMLMIKDLTSKFFGNLGGLVYTFLIRHNYYFFRKIFDRRNHSRQIFLLIPSYNYY